MENKQKEQIKERMWNLYRNISLNENGQVTNIQFCKEMQILPQENGSMGLEEDIYIVEKEIKIQKDVKEKTYELYLEEGQRVALISRDGEIIFDEAYIELLKERYKNLFKQIKIEETKITIDEVLEENKEKEQVEMTEEEIKEEEKNQSEQKENEENFQEETNENEEMKEISKVTGISEKEMRACTKINPNEKITDTENFYDIIPNSREYEKIYVVASNRNTKGNSKFHFVGVTKDGIAEQIEGLEPTEGINTSKEVISINRDGSEVKEKQVSALFKVGDYNKGFSVSIGDYGIIEAEYVRRTQSNQYISSNINTTTQKPTTKEVKEFMSDTRNPYIKDNADKAEEQIEEKESEKTSIKNIDDNEYNDTIPDVDEEIKLDNGNVTTIRKEAEKLGISIEAYVRKCEEEPEDTIQEKIKKTNKKIIEEDITGDDENEGERTEVEKDVIEEDEDEIGRTPWGDAYKRMNRI